MIDNKEIKNFLWRKEIIQTVKSLIFCTTLIAVLAATNSVIQGNTKPLALSILVIGSFSRKGVEHNISEMSSKMRDVQATGVASNIGKSEA